MCLTASLIEGSAFRTHSLLSVVCGYASREPLQKLITAIEERRTLVCLTQTTRRLTIRIFALMRLGGYTIFELIEKQFGIKLEAKKKMVRQAESEADRELILSIHRVWQVQPQQ